MLTLKTNTTANDPENKIPFLEKDYGIVRGATKVLIDFSHPDAFYGVSYDGAAIPAYTSIQNLVTSSDDMETRDGSLPNGTNAGTLTLPGLHSMRMPKDKLGLVDNRNITDFVFISWLNIEEFGFPNSANTQMLIYGDANNTSNNYGRLSAQFQSQTDNAQLQSFSFVFFGSSIGFNSAVRDSLVAGDLRQLAVRLVRETDSTARIDVYIDNTLMQSEVRNMTASDGSDVGSGYFSIGDTGAFNEAANNRLTIGRLNLADLSAQSMSGTDYITRDWNHARGFFGL